ncbi:MAG: glycosyltransferase family 2 protein [Chloroflexi bacterium]|nr:glycosyltransferase family 2 protein [Chloroflexota bacterium]
MENQEILVSMVIPAYNEEEAMGKVLDDITRVLEPLGVWYEVIVVDDGSTDGTVACCQAHPNVKVITHGQNRGTGAARTTGVRAARGRYIVMTDADGTYPAEAIPQMIAELETCDMVIGAREQEMGTVMVLRSLAKNFIRLLASYLTRTRIPDLNSGLRAMKREVVMKFLPILHSTHSWVSTITMAMLSNGYNVRWIPIAYYKRIGRSTFHPVTDTYNYLSLVVRTVTYFDPLRIFLPLSLGLFGVGVIKMIYDIFAYNFHLAPTTVIILLSAFQVGAIGLLADLIVRRSKL